MHQSTLIPTDSCPSSPPARLRLSIESVACSFSVGVNLNLSQVSIQGPNVERLRRNGPVTLKIKRPQATATIRFRKYSVLR